MHVVEMTVKPNKAEILRNLGYKDIKKVPGDVHAEVEKALEESSSLISPKVCYENFNFTVDKSAKKILLSGGNYFSGDYIVKNLSSADYITVAITTLGPGIDEKSASYFQAGDYMRGMIFDCIGSSALNALNRLFWLELVKKVKESGNGITHRLSPGHNDWDIKDQATVFKLLDTGSIGVTLNDSFMMNPVKSLSVVYGIGKGLEISTVDHDCIDCELEDCTYRLMPRKQHHIQVVINGQIREITVSHGANLFFALLENGIHVPNACGGKRTCGKCKVRIEGLKDIDLSPEEQKLLSSDAKGQGFRLACFTAVDQNIKVYIPEDSNKAVILTEGEKEQNIIKSLNPRIKKVAMDLPLPSLEDQRDDVTRLIRGLTVTTSDSAASLEPEVSDIENSIVSASYDKIKIPLQLLSKIPEILKENKYKVSCVIRQNLDNSSLIEDKSSYEIISVEESKSADKFFGIAVDIGTTTIAAYLYDIKSTRKIDIASSLNPQRIYGADVITRINHTMEDDKGLKQLQKLIIAELNDIITKFCKKNGLSPRHIYELTAVGNTTMMHLFLGIPCKNIANAPYIPAFTDKTETKARELGININPEGYIITLPMVSGYVGADTVAAVLASRMYEKEEIGLLLDIGTNGEIVLGNREKLLACSAAAGPAFEGAGITFGIGGVVGAIDHVDFGKNPIYTTIGGAPPVGLCGSGVVDAIAQLVKWGILEETGKVKQEDEIEGQIPPEILARITDYKDKRAFLLDERTGIYLTQQDVRQIQLAKGAIYAGIKILMNHMGITPDQINRVYFAGGFGNYISVESAVTIGLIPKELKHKVSQIGNAAGTGAIMALLSDDELKIANDIKNRIKYIELSAESSFQEEFMGAMYF